MTNPVRTINSSTELKLRIKDFVVRVIKLTDTFPKTSAGFKVGGQVVASAGSVGANYAEAQAARSRKEFISTTGIVLKESVETNFWLEIIEAVELTDQRDELLYLKKEGGELERIFAKIIITSKKNS